jgi:uncharacterized protein
VKKTLTWKKLYIGQTGRTGKGLFTKVNFKKGDHIFTWEGILKKGRYPCYVGARWLQIEKYEWIAPLRINPGYYINHSCSPNSGIRNSVKIVAMKNIRRGEEVTFDYSTSESENGWYLTCHCKNKNCRRIIRSYTFLSAELKLKYRDFISEYLKLSSIPASLDNNSGKLPVMSTLGDKKYRKGPNQCEE